MYCLCQPGNLLLLKAKCYTTTAALGSPGKAEDNGCWITHAVSDALEGIRPKLLQCTDHIRNCKVGRRDKGSLAPDLFRMHVNSVSFKIVQSSFCIYPVVLTHRYHRMRGHAHTVH